MNAALARWHRTSPNPKAENRKEQFLLIITKTNTHTHTPHKDTKDGQGRVSDLVVLRFAVRQLRAVHAAHRLRLTAVRLGLGLLALVPRVH